MKRILYPIISIAVAAFVIAIGGVDNVARGQIPPAAPASISATDGDNPGEVVLSWGAVADAAFYRVGWMASADFEAAGGAQGPHWAEEFRYSDIGNRGQTSHTITRLTPGIDYWFIVGSNDTRYGEPQWSSWAPLKLEHRGGTVDPLPTDSVPFDGSRLSSISSGKYHTCGIRQDGTVHCFGLDGLGQSSPPEGEFLSVSAGGNHSCGVKADAKIVCWGSSAVPSPPAINKFSSVSSGDVHSCGVTPKPESGYTEAICWGVPGNGRTDDRQALYIRQFGYRDTYNVETVSIGLNHNCLLDDNGGIICWGSNESGQLIGGSDAKAVSAGGEHTCRLHRDGTVTCSGGDASGQSTPPTVPEGDFDQEPYTYTTVNAGGAHTCAINGDGNATQMKGTVRCWGSNLYGESTPSTGIFVDVSAGAFHTCGLRQDGIVACWGDNTYGQAPR